jgi:hypothetical protein
MIQQTMTQAYMVHKNDDSTCMNTRCSIELTKQNRKVCGKCRMGAYCSKECQVHDWKRGSHKALCGISISTVNIHAWQDELAIVKGYILEKRFAFQLQILASIDHFDKLQQGTGTYFSCIFQTQQHLCFRHRDQKSSRIYDMPDRPNLLLVKLSPVSNTFGGRSSAVDVFVCQTWNQWNEIHHE